MTYVARGTVQVELSENSDKEPINVWINPTQEFTVTYDKDDYIVFMSDNAASLQDAKVFKKTQTFTAPFGLAQALTDAASKCTKIEIKIETSAGQPAIVSIKVPAPI